MTAPASVPRRLAVHRHDPAALVEEVAAQAEAGKGWINLVPDVGEGGDGHGEGSPSQSGSWFSGRGPAVPHATWVAGHPTRRGRREPARLGIEHGSGTRAAAQLAAAGHPVPTGWRVRQDHSRRGLVLDLPDGTAPAEAVEWLLGAAAVLSQVPTGDAWLAEVWAG